MPTTTRRSNSTVGHSRVRSERASFASCFYNRNRDTKVTFEHRENHTILGNRAELQQVIINLLMNAAQAMSERAEPDRKIWVSYAREDERVVVSVRDNGSGMPDDRLDKVFENFYTTSTDGLGMGLAVCRSFIMSHGGAIRAETRESSGATFLLPFQSGASAACT